jgi:hypothetical protein
MALTGTDRLSLLIEARDRLVDELRLVEGAAVATVSRELRAVLTEIDQIPGSGEVTPLDTLAGGIADDLAARRTAREAG